MKNQLTPQLRAFEADHAWVTENLGSLLQQYANQWVAVRDGQVIAACTELEALLTKLPDPAHTCIEFVTSEPLEMVL
ncbi:MAG: DUF5678 domain-containing protein [Planctomycetota bacterium]|nr:DUF5678 domain-containing protein [Planctomycetota bacterium]